MNWYKISQLDKESNSVMRFIGTLFAVGLAHAAVIAFLTGHLHIPEQKAEQLVRQYESQGNQPVVEPTNAIPSEPVAPQPEAAPEPEPVPEQTPTESAEDMIMRHEDFRSRSYPDANGRSIGYGYHLNNRGAREQLRSLGLDYDAVYRGTQRITEPQARILFERFSMPEARGRAERFAPDFEELPETIQNVLVDMSYNLGNRLNGFRRMRDAVENRDWDTMADEMVDSDWYNQVGRDEDPASRSRELERMVREQQ